MYDLYACSAPLFALSPLLLLFYSPAHQQAGPPPTPYEPGPAQGFLLLKVTLSATEHAQLGSWFL